MSREHELIKRTPVPATQASLLEQLRAAIQPGDVVLVHISLSALGWIVGGPFTLIQALLDAVGDGTLVMPAHSSQLTDPARWEMPPVPADWIDTIRAEMPAYDPATTPTRGLGATAELFRIWPDAQRSDHPNSSFAAIGPQAKEILAEHKLDSPLGEHSPLARLCDLDAKVVLLGVGFDSCTMLHLAELRAWPNAEKELEGAPIIVDGERQWVSYLTVPTLPASDLSSIGEQIKQAGLTRSFTVGIGEGMVMSTRAIVDYAVEQWKHQQRPD